MAKEAGSPGGDPNPSPMPPLAGVCVLDLAIGPLAKIGHDLAELGADVIRVEPRGGAPDRSGGCTAGGVSIDFALANSGKRSVALDIADPADLRNFERLLSTADILIETSRPGSEDGRLFDVASIRRAHPALVILSATEFGQTGRHRYWHATGPVLHALSGELSRSGIPGREPLLPPGNLPYDCAVSQAVFVILVAYYNRLRTGRGDSLDFSLLDAACQALDPGYGIAGSATAGVPASNLPRGRPEARFQYPIIPCQDGYVRLCVLAPRQWQGMFNWLGQPEAFADPSFNKLQTRFSSPTLIPAITQFFADKTREQLEQQGQRHGVPAAAVLDVAEFVASDQIRARRAFISVELAPGISMPVLDGIIEIDGGRAGAIRPAPQAGEHNHDVFATQENEPARPASAAENIIRPLQGLRVLDFGVIVVGAEQGRLLADAGADVIKVENPDFPDGSRQNRAGGLMSATFASGHRNKRSLGINLRDPRGRALLLDLVKDTDVILANFKSGTLDSLGLDYTTLSRINPGIIVVDSSAFGSSGPWSGRMGYGPLVRASAGLTAQWRYPGEPGSFSDAVTVYPDHVAGRIGAIAALALLIRRRRTKIGGAVNFSQAEVMLSHMAKQIAVAALQSAGQETFDEVQDVPWGVFPCKGDDEWCVITARHNSDWLALCGVIERPDLAADPSMATSAGRISNRSLIDSAVRAWLSEHTSHQAMECLQMAGVPAGAMLRVSELPEFPYYIERGFFRRVTHPHMDPPFFLETGPVRSENLPDPPERPAPLMGEHTVEIIAGRLGLSEHQINGLIAEKVLQVPPPIGASATA